MLGRARLRGWRRISFACGGQRGISMVWRAASALLAAGLAAVAACGDASASAPAVTPAAVTTASPAAARALIAATDARVVGDKDRTRFVLDLSDSVRPV